MDAELKAEVEELIERARAEIREERNEVLRRRTFRQDFLPNLAIAIVMIVGAWLLVTYEKRIDCHSRQSARNDLRAAVTLAIEGKDPNDPRFTHWFDAIAPGGSFSVIRC